jgi:hypothetical protein
VDVRSALRWLHLVPQGKGSAHTTQLSHVANCVPGKLELTKAGGLEFVAVCVGDERGDKS